MYRCDRGVQGKAQIDMSFDPTKNCWACRRSLQGVPEIVPNPKPNSCELCGQGGDEDVVIAVLSTLTGMNAQGYGMPTDQIRSVELMDTTIAYMAGTNDSFAFTDPSGEHFWGDVELRA